MTELFFIRHAETGLAGTFCGHSDPPVNHSGDLQILELIANLSSQPLQRVVSSDLQRAAYTAARIGEAFHLHVSTSAELREIGFGLWEGLRWEEIEARDPAAARAWVEAFPNGTPPGGEPFQQLRERVLRAVSLLITQAGNETVAVITHGGVMRVVLQELLHRSAEEAWTITQPYCSRFAYRPYAVRDGSSV